MSKLFALQKLTLIAGLAILIGLPTVGWTGDQVPLQATFGTNFQFAAGPDYCHASVPVTGIGQVSHVGNATVFIEQIVGVNNPGCPVLSSLSQNGTMTVTGANGDTLTATFTGTYTIDQSGILSAAGQMVFTGGSGRFQGASGNASFTVVANVATLQGLFTFSGSISSPGSLRQ